MKLHPNIKFVKNPEQVHSFSPIDDFNLKGWETPGVVLDGYIKNLSTGESQFIENDFGYYKVEPTEFIIKYLTAIAENKNKVFVKEEDKNCWIIYGIG